MTSKVGIIGCGWLGKALAKTLLAQQQQVKATSGRDESVEQLLAQGIDASTMTLPTNESPENLAQHPIFTMSHLIIAIPPRLKRGQSDYPEKVAQIINAAEVTGVQHIILLSSTAVYNGLHGLVDENSTLNFTADKVEIMHQTEQIVLNFSKFANVIRLAGLIGPERHPGRFLAGKQDLPNPEGSINLIHQQDAVGIILNLLSVYKNDNINKAIFNGASDSHESRAAFYQQATKCAGLVVPQFQAINDVNLAEQSKIISNVKVKEQLAYQFEVGDLMAWLKCYKLT